MAKRAQKHLVRPDETREAEVHVLRPHSGVWDPIDNRKNGTGSRRSGASAARASAAQAPRAEAGQAYTKNVKPKSENQKALIEAIADHQMVLALGPAGTGKTYLAVYSGLKALDEKKVDRIILVRPAIEAGENLGYLPGDMKDKLSPFLRPLYDVVAERKGGSWLNKAMEAGAVEIASVAHMRGRTLSRSFVVIDEAQNCTFTQLKMIVTRLGFESTMVLTGDPDQSDLLPGQSGLYDMAARLSKVEGIAVVRLGDQDIVRHPLVAKMMPFL
jgi:phosphate starvation-inducible PhoH-like protein